MRTRVSAVRRFVVVLVAGTCFLHTLGAQDSGRARIALYQLAGQKDDSTLAAVLSTVADSVELSLDVLQRYDVARLPAADPSTDLAAVKSYCEAHRVDQAIMGSGSARNGGGYDFRLVVYDRRKDSITVDQKGSSSGALDMFDTTDALVASLLDGLSGTHLLFGSLTVETEPAGAIVAVNGKEVGPSPLSLRGLPVGTVQVSAHASGRDDGAATVTITDGQNSDQSFTLARSMGTLTVKAPADSVVAVRSAEIGEKDLRGSGALTLPTGDYDVTATDSGLPTVPGKLTIARGQTLPWLPWSKAYLAIEAAAPGADVTVDGQDKGAAPQVVEVDPGTLHRVSIKAAHYGTYVADLGAAQGDKTSFDAELTPNPGSIKVVTSIPGVTVYLDDGEVQKTPAVFETVPGGLHKIKFSGLTVDNRIYLSGDPVQVEVKPDEQALVSRGLVLGNGTLSVTDAPPGSIVTMDGATLDPSKAFSTGVPVQAGYYDVTVTAPSSQRWTQSTVVYPGTERKLSISGMTWHLARRTIKMDGKPDNWKDIAPYWETPYPLGFSGQPGTRFARGYACRDDQFFYLRFEFSDGTPTRKLAGSIDANLMYLATIDTPKGQLQPRVRFYPNDLLTELFCWIEASKTGLHLVQNFKYQIGESALEMAVPLSYMKTYVGSQSALIILHVVNEDSGYNWKDDLQSSGRAVAFDF